MKAAEDGECTCFSCDFIAVSHISHRQDPEESKSEEEVTEESEAEETPVKKVRKTPAKKGKAKVEAAPEEQGEAEDE